MTCKECSEKRPGGLISVVKRDGKWICKVCSEEIVISKRSKRGQQWLDFVSEVYYHIENYTISQYGDYPDDNVEQWTAADCIRQIEKYTKRHGRNSRPDNDKLDLLKIAHYACLAFDKMEGR